MSSNQEDIRAIRQDLKQLQGVLASKSKGDELSKNSLQVLVDDMHSLSEEVRSSNVQYRESLSTLKTLAENERKALQSQISNERLLAATQRDSYEEKIAKLMQDKALFDIDKEKLDRGQRQLERSEALFEQRKIAAREEIETADTLMTAIRSAESRLNDEMERLNDLRNYVKEKDDEATMKLEQAHELSKKVREMEVTLEDTEYQRQELSKARMSLVQERVAMLKDRARERENERLSSSSSSIKDDLVLVRRRPTEFSADFPFVSSNARMALAMIKGDLKKLRKDQ
jgi:chromosome segregation ATPase